MFVRIKKIKEYNYAYLVKNTWTSKGPRQKTKKYLGRCVTFENLKKLDFLEYYSLNDEKLEQFVFSNDTKKVLGRIIEFELIKCGFKPIKRRKGMLELDNLVAKSNNFKIYGKKGKNDIVLKINEGYFCEYMIKKILTFKFKGDEYDDPVNFAEVFINAGINLDKRLFILLYRKISG